jgi:hypothetical protein
MTGTPVIDPRTRTAYFFAKKYLPGRAGPTKDDAAWFAHAVDVDTLVERPGFPLRIEGAAQNDPEVTFTAFEHLQRPGLLYMNGVVYAGFGGLCDLDDYRGWVIGVGTDGRIRTMFATEAGPRKVKGAGIWQSGGGLVSDGPGRIFFITGNGYSNALTDPTPGRTPPPTLDQSIVRVDLQSDGTLRAMDFFAPHDIARLDVDDIDFGSGAPVALPSPPFATPALPQLIVAGGKTGILYLLSRNDLGGFQLGPNRSDKVIGSIQLVAGLWSRPAVWPGNGGYVYAVISAAPMQALKFGVDAAGTPSLSVAGRTGEILGYASGSPIVTADGTTPGTALVWATARSDTDGQGQLRAYDAVPNAQGILPLRFEDAYGAHAKFSVPGVGNGRVYVGTTDGHVIGYGAPKRQ